jgi:hypothetical protein
MECKLTGGLATVYLGVDNIPFWDNRTTTYLCAYHINPHALAAQVQFAVLENAHLVKAVGSRRILVIIDGGFHTMVGLKLDNSLTLRLDLV